MQSTVHPVLNGRPGQVHAQRRRASAAHGWGDYLQRALALAVLLLPGIVWFPGDAAAQADIAPWESGGGGLWLKASSEDEPVPALSVGTQIRARVTGNTGRIEVTQRFSNPRDEWVEGLYVFPLPADAAVDQMEMQVGDRIIRGEIQPREEARRTYEAARDSGRRASLVEQARPNMFTTSVANIPPGGEVTVRIAYLTVIPWRDARYELKLPMAITPRFAPAADIDAGGSPAPVGSTRLTRPEHNAPELVAPGLQTARIDIELNAGLPLATLHSPSHAIEVEAGIAIGADAGRWQGGETSATPGRRRIIVAAAPMDRDFELSWSPVIAPETRAAIYTQEFGGETYALVMLAPPAWGQSPGANWGQSPTADWGQSPPREVIFIIDTSGSMGGPPIQQAKSALALALQQLGPHDRFNIIEFNSEARALFRAPMEVGDGTRATALRFIARLEANGGTLMHPALDMAFQMRATAGMLRQVIFITDGSVGNETEVLALVENQLGEARLFTVGIGPAPNDWFMREVAAAGRGSYTFIADVAQVGPRMGQLFSKLQHPALVDLELHWPGGTTADLATPLPRDLYAGDPVAVAARLTGAPLTGSDPGKTLTLIGFSGGAAWSRQAPLQRLEGEAGIAKLWARERIAELSRRKRLAGGGATTGRLSREAIDAEIEALAMGYGLVSERTSLVAVDVTPARPAGAAMGREQAPTAAPNGTAWARSSAFAQTATPAALFRWIGMVLLALAVLVARPAWPRWLHP